MGRRAVIWPSNEEPRECIGQIHRIRRTFLFGDDFNRADRRVVDSWSKVDLYFTLRRGFDMLEGLDQRLGAGFPENIKSFQKHHSVTRDVEHTAAHTSNAAVLNAKPVLHKVQLQCVFAARRNRNYVMEVSKTMPFVKTAVGDSR